MSIGYGNNGYAVSPGNISIINLTSTTFNGTFIDSGYSGWSFTASNQSCGSTGVSIIINDASIPFVWTRISWKTYVEMRSSCWDFANNNGAYGQGTHNIASWNPSLGDAISRPINCFELPQYALKMNACDDASDNFNHGTYATGTYRQWNMYRRRNGTGAAGPAAGFACAGGGNFKISQVMVYR